MDTPMRTLQVTLPVSDAAFLRLQSRKMGWGVTSVRSHRKSPKVEMTEEEFRDKLMRKLGHAA